MNNIIALCRCVKKIKNNNVKDKYFEFHFKGVYSGNKVRRIIGAYDGIEKITMGDDYILYIGDVEIQEADLIGTIWRLKRIDHIYS